ncbi:MAG TPA: Na/Pi cotransporter family protein [Syntrophales bacterium]|jgi:phosphate:Na+ symporter|nr:Na/Pi cotransporter family protein [Syntrophales bacterium]HQA83162.1 Na/Pi cotransporter family protein [Syntrophales bacterium]
MKSFLLLCAGLVLFLFAMMQLSTAVQQLFTFRIRKYIKYVVQKPLSGLLTGVATTILFQSSSATTVLTVGMVSAGLISFYHSLGILLGADVGTVLTVQLVVWKFTDFSPVFIISGGLLWFSRFPRWKIIGEVLFYFGLLFFGLSLTSDATAPLKDSEIFVRFFRETTSPLVGFAIGLLFTVVVHASVIPISILVILAQQDLMTLQSALPIVFGANVGTTVTALMAGTIAGISGRRTAVSHFLFKLIGALACMITLYWLTDFLAGLPVTVPQQIVFGHLLFNLSVALVFIFLLKPFARMVEWLIPGTEETLPLTPEYLDEKRLQEPEIALDCVRKELEREITLAGKMMEESTSLLDRYDKGKDRNIGYIEMVVDHLRHQIVRYLWKISNNELTEPRTRRLFLYTAMADDIERIGDHAMNILELARSKHHRGVQFSWEGEKEKREIERLVFDNLRMAKRLLDRDDPDLIRKITDQEEEVDVKTKEARENHLVRFYSGICQDEAGPIFIEYLVQLERVSDHCQNIADYTVDLNGR